jgi:Xaa-Pro aminopeptidase
VPDVLIWGDTLRSPALRHEVPLSIPDPFLYVERDGARYVAIGSLELPRVGELDGLEMIAFEELGVDELMAAGVSWEDAGRELALRACRRLGVEEAVAPAGFPLAVGDHLRGGGVGLTTDHRLFAERRRAKSTPELEGIRRAQRACEAAMDAIRERLRAGSGATSEELRSLVLDVFSSSGASAADLPIVSHGGQSAIGHDVGSGAASSGEPIVVDLFPQDLSSACFADMTRTFCLGDPPAELVEYHGLCREALELAVSAIRPGVPGREVFARVCDLFETAGYLTQRTKEPGSVLTEGFFHSLGHGVGLEVHEEPALGRSGIEPLVPGDVLAVEPGLYRAGFGGCRLEDLVLVTEDGCEVLTSYPYDLAP